MDLLLLIPEGNTAGLFLCTARTLDSYPLITSG